MDRTVLYSLQILPCITPLRLALASELFNLNDDKLRRFQRREADEDIHDAPIDVVLRRGFLIALDEIRVCRSLPLKGAFPKQFLHERPHIEPDRSPQGLVIGFKHHPLRSAIKAFFDKQRDAPYWDVFPQTGVRARHRTGPQTGNNRKQLRPNGFSTPFSGSLSG